MQPISIGWEVQQAKQYLCQPAVNAAAKICVVSRMDNMSNTNYLGTKMSLPKTGWKDEFLVFFLMHRWGFVSFVEGTVKAGLRATA